MGTIISIAKNEIVFRRGPATDQSGNDHSPSGFGQGQKLEDGLELSAPTRTTQGPICWKVLYGGEFAFRQRHIYIYTQYLIFVLCAESE